MILETLAGASSILGRSMTIELRVLVPDVQKYALDGALAVPDLGPYSEVSAPDKKSIKVQQTILSIPIGSRSCSCEQKTILQIDEVLPDQGRPRNMRKVCELTSRLQVQPLAEIAYTAL
jgi:hypothetical protein